MTGGLNFSPQKLFIKPPFSPFFTPLQELLYSQAFLKVRKGRGMNERPPRFGGGLVALFFFL